MDDVVEGCVRVESGRLVICVGVEVVLRELSCRIAHFKNH
jgi:hypothetical protein